MIKLFRPYTLLLTISTTAVCDIITKVFVEYQVHEYPVLVRTYVDTNTTFVIDQDITVQVTNAPTSLDFFTKGRSTRKVTTTISP